MFRSKEGWTVPLLEINGVCKRFGGLAAVANLDLAIEQGEIAGLIGPNGSGKTTVFNMICGFFNPDAGAIHFNGEDITKLAPNKVCKKGIARAFQVVKPFGDLSVCDNVVVGALSNTAGIMQAREEALKILEFVGLKDRTLVLAKGLTIAGRKRLELARALATKPKLLLLDEVMAGLTPKESEEAILPTYASASVLMRLQRIRAETPGSRCNPRIIAPFEKRIARETCSRNASLSVGVICAASRGAAASPAPD